MGAGNSTPFNYDGQLLGDTSRQYTVEVKEDGATNDNCGLPRRSAEVADHLITHPFEAEVAAGKEKRVQNIWDCFQRGVEKFPSEPCLGTRQYTVDADGKVVIKDKAPARGDYQWETYKSVDQQARNVGAGLLKLGGNPQDNVGIFSANRAEWVISMLGFFSQSMRCVSLYATLGDEAVEYIINHGDIKIVLAAKENMKELLKSAKKTKLTHIVQFDPNPLYKNNNESIDPAEVAECEKLGIKLIGFSELQKLGAEAGNFPTLPAPSDYAYVMYTSGTTGNPKGALLRHSNIVAAMAAAAFAAPLGQTDVHLSYLPLAHIFESVVLTAMLLYGGRIGFFQNNIRKLTDDMLTLQPTFLAGVPRVFSRIYQTVQSKVGTSGCVKKWYFNRAYQYQCDCVRAGKPRDATYDARVFAVIRKTVGLGRCRFVLSGAAPLPPFLSEFLKVVINCDVLQGYGMTENAAGACCAKSADVNVGHVGPCVPCCEIKLVDIPDMGYTHLDKPNPRGEIWIRGPNVFAGYYKDEVNTAATITADGWLCTGDVGRWNPNGTLSIIDRKKNMFKLSQGEYIAVEKVENIYAKSPIAGQLWVYGNSFKSFLLAVIVPAADTLATWLVAQGWWPGPAESARLGSDTFSTHFAAAINGPNAAAIKKYVFDQLKEQDKPLKGFEKVMDIIVEGNINALGMGFTEQNGCLTPTFKLRRPQLLQRYITQLKELYAKNGEAPAPDEKWPGEP